MSTWSLERAEEHLLSLELFGMRFGLERMRRLTTAMGAPQQRFGSIHVVGTNGKSSTVRMAAAILQRHGLRTGAYTSPHLVSFTERVQVGERDLEPAAFAAAVERAAQASGKVNRTLADGERVTQFELLTAAAYWALAEQGVEVAVVEAGLGGRFDATNVIPSRVTVLTNVGLEHTRWLGPTISDIAREKLAVLRPASVLVVGELEEPVMVEAEAAARAAEARLIRAGPAGLVPRALGPFQEANFAVARAAAQAYLGRALDPPAVEDAARSVAVPGRLEVMDRDPLTLYDAAHNPAGARALAAALPGLRRPGRLVAVVSVLEDKDAAGILEALLACCDAVVLTANANPRALPPATLQSLAGQVRPQGPPSHVEPDPRRAVQLARDLAGADGTVLVTGSIYLIADLLRGPRARASVL